MTVSLVTGGAGFIGSHVADRLLKMGHKVVVLDDLSGGCLENLTIGTLLDRDLMPIGVNPAGEGAIMVVGSILDTHCIDNIFSIYKPDYVFHLAAYAAESLSHFIRRYNYETNVIGSVNLINAAVNYGVKRFVFTSSAAVYGHGASDVDELWKPAPIDPYGVAKYAVEMDLQAASEQFGLPYTIFRCHNVYGVRQNLNDGYRNVIGIFMRQVLQGQPMTIFGTGKQTRQFTCIDDIVSAIAQCVERPNTVCRVFNIGSDERYAVEQIAELVAEAFGCAPQIEYMPQRDEVLHVSLNHDLYQALFGIPTIEDDHYFLRLPKTSIQDGIRRMAEWAKTQTLREPRPFAQIEIEKNMPESWRKLHVDRTSHQ